MFRKTKTRDFKVFLAFLLLFSGKKRNVLPCLILNPFSLQTTIITKRFLSFISSLALFSTPRGLWCVNFTVNKTEITIEINDWKFILHKRSQIVWNVETQDVPELPVEFTTNVKCNLRRSDGLSIRLTCTFLNSLKSRWIWRGKDFFQGRVGGLRIPFPQPSYRHTSVWRMCFESLKTLWERIFGRRCTRRVWNIFFYVY